MNYYGGNSGYRSYKSGYENAIRLGDLIERGFTLAAENTFIYGRRDFDPIVDYFWDIGLSEVAQGGKDGVTGIAYNSEYYDEADVVYYYDGSRNPSDLSVTYFLLFPRSDVDGTKYYAKKFAPFNPHTNQQKLKEYINNLVDRWWEPGDSDFGSIISDLTKLINLRDRYIRIGFVVGNLDTWYGPEYGDNEKQFVLDRLEEDSLTAEQVADKLNDLTKPDHFITFSADNNKDISGYTSDEKIVADIHIHYTLN